MTTITTLTRRAVGAVLALGVLVPFGAGTAHADAIQVEGDYATLADCQADGPTARITQNDGAYSHWSCHRGEDGLYYLYLSN